MIESAHRAHHKSTTETTNTTHNSSSSMSMSASSSSSTSALSPAPSTVAELKELLRAQGKKLTGKKADLQARLNGTEVEVVAPKKKKGKVETAAIGQIKATGAEGKVNKMLFKAGITHPEHTSKCARLAIYRGYIVFHGTAEELDQPARVKKGKCAVEEALEVSCIDCSEQLYPTIRDLLKQSDVPGTDYEDGGER